MDEKQAEKQGNQTPDKNEEAPVKLDKSDVDEVSGGNGGKSPIVTPEL